MDFAERLANLRKEKGLTQRQLADLIGVHVTQVNRYEAGESQPTLEIIRQMAVVLGVSADKLIFGKDERGPDDTLRLQFEQVAQFDEEDKELTQGVLEGLILKHQAKQMMVRQAAAKKAQEQANTKPVTRKKRK